MLPFDKDRHGPAEQHFLIVKSKRRSLQDGHSSLCLEHHPTGLAAGSRTMVRRRITRDAGLGLEKLGHALEYLTDEFVHDGCRFAEDHGRLQAIELLASLNRQIYFACRIEPSFGQRVQTLFRRWFRPASVSS